MKPIGFVDQLSRSHITGWAADTENLGSSVTLAVFVNGQGYGTVKATRHRAGLQDLAEGATGNYEFVFYFATPLLAYHRYEITVRVAGTDFLLKGAASGYGGQTTFVLDPIDLGEESDRFRARGPVLVSTLGRSGSTALMRTLGQHAGIVVAGERPFEVELGCYYAYALYVLLSEGDHARSLQTDRITAVSDQRKIGFNPYYVPQFAGVFGKSDVLRRFLNVRAPRRIVPAFRELILDYYQYVAEDQGKPFPVYFAEKVLPEPQARFGIRAMFGNTREIVLVRDARDVLCSFMASGGLTFEQALTNALNAASRYLEIKKEQNTSIHFVRYEDYVLDQANVISGVLDFLGLPASRPNDEDGMANLFQVHGTSATPEASIARWQRDLKSEQLAQMDGLKDFLATFGYEA